MIVNDPKLFKGSLLNH